MEANSTTILGLMKWLFPSLIGAVGAVWFKRNEIDWVGKTTIEKVLYTLLGICAIAFGCVIGFTVAQVIVTYLNMTDFWYSFATHAGCGLVSLKVLDSIVKNTDDILSIITTGVKDALTSFFNKFKGGGE